MEQVKRDLATLGLSEDVFDTITVKEARMGYHKRAKEFHPDKADRNNEEEVAKNTEAFKEVGNAYERILRYIIENLKAQNDKNLAPATDEDIFARENFDKFNFPSENVGSFTVRVEDHLAEVWQECLQQVYGEPRIVKVANTGTESDRIWKIMHMNNMEITLHFYNHNKPKDKKQSKILVQGGRQSLLCEFVFGELPRIYKMVTTKQKQFLPILRESKRKRVATPVKKRNIKQKPGIKELDCSLCDFTSTTKVKIIKHMKSSHTDQEISKTVVPINTSVQILNEDMSITDVAEDTTEKLLIENIASKDDDFQINHNEEESTNKVKAVMNNTEEISFSSLYKCDECDFGTFTMHNLQEHKKNKHVKENITLKPTVYLHTCISCDYKTNDYSSLNEHINEIHRNTENTRTEACNTTSSLPKSSPMKNKETCPFCELKLYNLEDLRIHFQQTHATKEAEIIPLVIETEKSETCFTCEGCQFVGTKLDLEEHIQSEHEATKSQPSLEHHTCEVCGLVLATISLHEEHMNSHGVKDVTCQYCDHKSKNEDAMKNHVFDSHGDVIMFQKMAQQVNYMSKSETLSLETFENFKSELFTMFRQLSDDHNAMKQELFLIRNKLEISAQSQEHTPRVPQPSVPTPLPPSNPSSPRAKTTTASAMEPLAPGPCLASPASKMTKSSTPISKSTYKSSIPIPSKSPQTSATLPESSSRKILYVGDSISSNVDLDTLQEATNAEFVTAKAYSAVHDEVSNIAKQAPKFPAANFTDVINNKINKEEFEYVIIQAGSIDITNLNTKDNPTEYMEYYRQETVISATNIFNAGENALRLNPNIKKVVIMKHIPRYDPAEVDPLGLKPSLSLLFNNTLGNLWMESKFKQKMFIGNHNIDCNGAIREARYRHTKSGRFDGIHLYGSSGMKAYTQSVMNILRTAKLIDDYHLSCPQYVYQNRYRSTNRRQPNRSDGMHYNKNKQKIFQSFQPLPTYSRFEPLFNYSQGN